MEIKYLIILMKNFFSKNLKNRSITKSRVSNKTIALLSYKKIIVEKINMGRSFKIFVLICFLRIVMYMIKSTSAILETPEDRMLLFSRNVVMLP